jgi:hypothetical protein
MKWSADRPAADACLTMGRSRVHCNRAPGAASWSPSLSLNDSATAVCDPSRRHAGPSRHSQDRKFIVAVRRWLCACLGRSTPSRRYSIADIRQNAAVVVQMLEQAEEHAMAGFPRGQTAGEGVGGRHRLARHYSVATFQLEGLATTSREGWAQRYLQATITQHARESRPFGAEI